MSPASLHKCCVGKAENARTTCFLDSFPSFHLVFRSYCQSRGSARADTPFCTVATFTYTYNGNAVICAQEQLPIVLHEFLRAVGGIASLALDCAAPACGFGTAPIISVAIKSALRACLRRPCTMPSFSYANHEKVADIVRNGEPGKDCSLQPCRPGRSRVDKRTDSRADLVVDVRDSDFRGGNITGARNYPSQAFQ